MWLAALATTLLLHCNTAADAYIWYIAYDHRTYMIMQHEGLFQLTKQIHLRSADVFNVILHFFAPQKVLLIVVPPCDWQLNGRMRVLKWAGFWEYHPIACTIGASVKLSFVFYFLLSIPHLSARWRPIIKDWVHLPLRFF